MSDRLYPLLRKLLLVALILQPAVSQVAKEPEPGLISFYIARLLERGHLTRQMLDENLSSRLLDSYLESLDYRRMFFTQEDVEQLRAKYGTELQDYIKLSNPAPVFEIYELFEKRVDQRVALVDSLLDTEFSFDSQDSIMLDRSEAPWPADQAAAQDLWRKRIESELLQIKLSEVSDEPGTEIVARRYELLQKRIKTRDKNDIIYDFLGNLARVYDPHSEYLDPDDLENFEINMRLSLVGIGAVLRSEEGYAEIVELVPGGPADMGGQLNVKDRIAGVAQDDSEFVEVLDMELDEVVKMIRGEKGTTVRLLVIPAKSLDPSQKKVVSIVRDKVELKEQEAYAEVIERIEPNGKAKRLGWITLPSFYADMSASRPSNNAKSTTRDVEILLERLKQEKIEGLVVDLRTNGGGSLEEAVNLTGLFIKEGPVVQAKDTQGNITISHDRNSDIAYEGPMIVLTSRLSASASEIFAGALQDYNRAVIVGDTSTFGKGTVQTMLSIGRFMSPVGGEDTNAGALKLTIQQFYRPSGQSTQLRGVVSDIVLPTLTDQKEIGESALDEPLPYGKVDPLPIDKFAEQPLYLDELRKRSQTRVMNSREFRYVMSDIERLEERKAKNTISLNEAERREQIEREKQRSEKRIAEREQSNAPQPIVYKITLDNVSNPELQLASDDTGSSSSFAAATSNVENDYSASTKTQDDADSKQAYYDVERFEALNILSDLIELSAATAITASVE